MGQSAWYPTLTDIIWNLGDASQQTPCLVQGSLYMLRGHQDSLEIQGQGEEMSTQEMVFEMASFKIWKAWHLSWELGWVSVDGPLDCHSLPYNRVKQWQVEKCERSEWDSKPDHLFRLASWRLQSGNQLPSRSLWDATMNLTVVTVWRLSSLRIWFW